VSETYGIEPLLCYHGVDARMFRPDLEIKQQSYVLSVGAIQPRKGFDFLIESLGLLPEADRPPLRLVGNVETDGYGAALRRLADDNRVCLDIEVGVSQEVLVRRYNASALMAYAP